MSDRGGSQSEVRRRFDRAANNLERALQNCKEENGLRARLLIRLADIQHLRRNDIESRACAESATLIAKKTGSLKLEAEAKYFLSGLETAAGALAEGIAKLAQSLALSRQPRRETANSASSGGWPRFTGSCRRGHNPMRSTTRCWPLRSARTTPSV